MSTNYASILASKYQSHDDTSMHGEVELAFVVVDVLSEANDITSAWGALLKSARGLIKTRAKRSRTRFRMDFKKAIENSDLSSGLELPGQELPTNREEKFKVRLANPQFMRRRVSSPVINKPTIVPSTEEVIISEDKPCTEEREDEFNRRLKYPGSFRRSN